MKVTHMINTPGCVRNVYNFLRQKRLFRNAVNNLRFIFKLF